ncbi:hypothetical protein Poly30_00740 [Planctomycetes bacterium Poly30]|uniref:Uncharacterized protein n=1 Tax=Saltatorellus ferox TaxID=2528018 RepID=A0A518EKG7_9BACT|nr:hypothetical protein Poly30_00740 [Planctomycetes bacterium Poly30]
MHPTPRLYAAIAATSALASVATAQQCYSPQNQCFSFAPPAEEMERIETGLELRSNALTLTGDIRFRARAANAPDSAPYNGNDQQTMRTRIQMDYQVNDYIQAFVEFNFSEVWAGAEGYSDAQPDLSQDGFASRTNFNGIGQAYMQLDNAFELGEKLRIGRSNYFLANGLVLGSCDFLQYPGAFTGAWLSRSFDEVDVELFAFDNYGPLQSQLPGGGERYAGGTARWNASEDSYLRTLNAYYMAGLREGDVTRNGDDSWVGVEADGNIEGLFEWIGQFGHRTVGNGGKDVSAYRIILEKNFDAENGEFLRRVAVTRTESEGALHINPADFNTAGLLHQYGGIWRSNLATNQLSVAFTPGWDLDMTASVMTLDRRGSATQLGDFETDLLIGKEFRSGLHAGFGFGIDNDDRKVGYLQLTTYF